MATTTATATTTTALRHRTLIVTEVPMFVPAALASIAFAALLVACALGAAGDATLGESFARVLADPWGRTMVVDLNAGFVAFLIVVWLFEPRRAVAVVVTLLTPVLGNFVPLAWLLWRLPLLRQRAGSRAAPGPR